MQIYKCFGYNSIYYSKNKRRFNVQIGEYLGTSHLTSKKVKIDNNTLIPIQKHLLCWKWSPSFEDFSILIVERDDFKFKIIESLEQIN